MKNNLACLITAMIFMILSGCKQNSHKKADTKIITLSSDQFKDSNKEIENQEIRVNPNFHFDFSAEELNYSTLLEGINTKSDIKQHIANAASESNLALVMLLDSIYHKEINASKYYFMLEDYNYYMVFSDEKVFNYLIENQLLISEQQIDSIKLTVQSLVDKDYKGFQHFLDCGMRHYLEFNIVREDEEGCNADILGIVNAIYSLDDTLALNIILDNGENLYNSHFYIAKGNCFQILYNYLNKKKQLSNDTIQSVVRLSIDHGLTQKFEKFLANNFNINSLDSLGRTVIYSSIYHQQIGFPCCEYPIKEKYELFKLLIDKGADINIQDIEGITPLMVSTEVNYCSDIILKTKFTKKLLELEASTYVLDKKGNSFWDYIIINKNLYYMKYFASNNLTPRKYKLLYDSIYKANIVDSWINGKYDRFEE